MPRRKRPSYYLIHYPAVKTVVIFILGIVLAELFDTSLTFWPFIVLAVLGIALVLERIITEKTESFSTVWLTGLLLVFSFFWAEFHTETKIKKAEFYDKLSSAYDLVYVKGVVSQVKETPKGMTVLIQSDFWSPSIDSVLDVDSGEIGLVQVVFYANDSLPKPSLYPGDTISLLAKTRKTNAKRNPNQFDYAAYLMRSGIVAQLTAINLLIVEEPKGFNLFKKKAILSVEKLFKPSHHGIAKALLLGDKSDVHPDMRLQFNRSGLAHLMAVSGLHVGFIVAPLWFLIPFVWTTQVGRYISIIVLGLMLLFYCWLTGFSPSVVRASLMAWLFSYGKLFEKVRHPMNIVGFSAFVLLLYNPEYVFDVGFQLSFGAVSIIILVFPFFYSMLKNTGRYRKILASIVLGIVVQLGLSPILMAYFGELSLISPLTNIFAMIPASAMVLLGLVSMMFTLYIPSLSEILSYPLAFLVDVLQWLAQYFSASEWSYAEFPKPSPLFFVFWFFLLATLTLWQLKELRWKWVVLTVLAWILFRAEVLFESMKPKELEVSVLDIGQGDATILTTALGNTLLIDTGIWTMNYDSGTRTIIPELKAKGINHISGIVLTHTHADHIGGTEAILEYARVDTLYTDSASVKDKSFLYKRILKSAREKNIPIKPLFAGDRLYVDESVFIQVVWPVKRFQETNLNEYSTVLRLDYGQTSFLFTGDAEQQAEEWLSAHLNEAIDTDWLKVGHHGSRSSSCISFLDDVTPELATVSVGWSNKYKHPHAESMIRIQKFTRKLHFTSLEGAGVFKSDGKQIKKINWQPE